MKKITSLCGALFLAFPGPSVATDYPLAFKTLDAQQALSFPAGSTTYAMIQAGKPAGIVKAPPAVSQHPLYGTIAAGPDQFLFRLDESKGTGQSYDRLIVDVNRNGDLTDDPVGQLRPSRRPSLCRRHAGAIPVWADSGAGDGQDRGATARLFCAGVCVYATRGGDQRPAQCDDGGDYREAGWYLEATVDVNGKHHKVDLVDANCNFRVGDPERPTMYKSGVNGSESDWRFQGGDRFLVDWPGVGRVQSSLVENQSCAFSPILYLDAKPYRVTLAADSKTLSLDPWREPLAELALQPHGEQVSSVELAWEQAPGDWVLLKPAVENATPKCRGGTIASMRELEGQDGVRRFPGHERHQARAEGGIKAVAGVSAFLELRLAVAN